MSSLKGDASEAIGNGAKDDRGTYGHTRTRLNVDDYGVAKEAGKPKKRVFGSFVFSGVYICAQPQAKAE